MHFERTYQKPPSQRLIAYFNPYPCYPSTASTASAWKYDSAVREFFVETCTKQTIRQTELQKQQEVVDASDTLQHHPSIGFLALG